MLLIRVVTVLTANEKNVKTNIHSCREKNIFKYWYTKWRHTIKSAFSVNILYSHSCFFFLFISSNTYVNELYNYDKNIANINWMARDFDPTQVYTLFSCFSNESILISPDAFTVYRCKHIMFIVIDYFQYIVNRN